MPVFRASFHDDERYIEADDMGHALQIWQRCTALELASIGISECPINPDAIEEVSDQAVMDRHYYLSLKIAVKGQG